MFSGYFTGDCVQLHTGVVVGIGLRLGRRLEEGKRSWRGDVGNLEGERCLMETWRHMETHEKE